jgi:protein-L-isoaspartate O-methyltransferase
MVVPIEVNGKQKMHVIKKCAEGKLTIEDVGECEFVPFLEGTVGKVEAV